MDYGYIIITSVLIFILNIYLSIKVGQARKKYDVKYPTMYDPTKPEFDNVQRGHQNFLEFLPFFLMFLFIGGIYYPLTVSVCGVLQIIGRVMFAQGYASKGPEGRSYGGIFRYPPLLIKLICTIMVALKILGFNVYLESNFF